MNNRNIKKSNFIHKRKINFELKSRYENFFGKGSFDKLIDAKKKYSKNQFLRINLSKSSVVEVEDFLKKNRVKFSKTFIENALKIEKSFFNLSGAPEGILGKYYLQDLASQIPVNCINFKSLKSQVSSRSSSLRVLDMAASPGSKTTQIADMLNYHNIDYKIVALEPEVKRLTKLINNIQKQGFRNIEIYNSYGQDFKSDEKFDLILLDAPCSGNLVGDRDWLEKRNVKGIEQNAKVQRELLTNAYNLLSENGILIYSTCSLEPEENEINVDWFMKNFKVNSFRPKIKFPFSTKPLSRYKRKDLKIKDCLRFMPYESKTQGFFVCCFIKNSD